jgi:hypothetical protein
MTAYRQHHHVLTTGHFSNFFCDVLRRMSAAFIPFLNTAIAVY